jgi:hypothetical protein
MQFTKHIHVLHLLSTMPAPVLTEHVAGNKQWQTSKSPISLEDAVACWDHMFTYIHEHWAKPMSAGNRRITTSAEQSEYVDCYAMLRMPHDELVAKLESLPPYFREEIFPVAVGRYLLRDLQLPLDHRKATTFLEFHSRYGSMILGC